MFDSKKFIDLYIKVAGKLEKIAKIYCSVFKKHMVYESFELDDGSFVIKISSIVGYDDEDYIEIESEELNHPLSYFEDKYNKQQQELQFAKLKAELALKELREKKEKEEYLRLKTKFEKSE